MLEQVIEAFGERYRVERELGRGGMATVYLAHDPRHDRPIALKVLLPELAVALGPERFAREIRLAARLQHPHILPVLDSGEVAAGGTPVFYYTMPFVAGESLRARLEREGPLPADDAIRLTREVADALDHAHRHGIIHRDVKPENILISDGHALLADFGIARAVADAGDRLTATGLSLGTPAYMSPEQATADPRVDARTDIYSLGCVLHEMLAGEPPFTGPSAQAVIAKRFASAPLSVRTVRPQLPASVDLALAKALALAPADRFTTAAEFAAALGREMPHSPRATRRWPLAAAGALAIAVAAFALRLRDRDRGSPPETSTIAVLPFASMGGDTADAWFAEGMADELTTALTKVPGVRVAARSSAARFRDSNEAATEIGQALGVGAVLAGTVRRAADRLRVSVELTGTADGLVLWSDRFDREVSDVFAVQDEIAAAVVSALRGRLVGRDSSALAPRGTRDLVAYDAYLKGRFAWSKRGEQGLRDAIDFFSAAVSRDPAFARGHAGLAMAYVVIPFFARSFPADSALSLAEASAERALALDSTLSDAHLALANLEKMQWRFGEAERHFRMALALAPEDPAVLHWYGVYLYATGRARESVERLAHATRIDPFGTAPSSDYTASLWAAGRHADAIVEARRNLALDPAKSDTWLVLGLAHLALANPDSALHALAEAHRFGTAVDVRSYQSVALRQLGDSAGADSVYRAIRRDQAAGRAMAFDVALAAAAAGDRTVALDAIEQTLEERHMFVTEFSLPCEPLFTALRTDSRFIAALERAGMQSCATLP
ncbi:MAG TPA: protein kinase [Gemmatimonadales bacterium]|nr:protein kinase [Gemmatimonadales bacterium]